MISATLKVDMPKNVQDRTENRQGLELEEVYDLEIVKQGANARALKATEFDNPYYKADKMPRATGESMDVWLKKSRSWAHGWMMENIMGR